MSDREGYGKAAGIGGAIFGGTSLGFVAGAAAGGAIFAAPAVAVVGLGAGIGAGLGALGKLIFSQIIKKELDIIFFEFQFAAL